MSENNEAEETLNGHEASERGLEGNFSDSSESIAVNLVEYSNGVSESPFETVNQVMMLIKF